MFKLFRKTKIHSSAAACKLCGYAAAADAMRSLKHCVALLDAMAHSLARFSDKFSAIYLLAHALTAAISKQLHADMPPGIIFISL